MTNPHPVRARRPLLHRAVATLVLGSCLGVTAGHAVAADPIMPLSEVKPGMTGTAYTVVSGTQITTFPVTILDVQDLGDAPGNRLIVIRAEGPLMDQTGGIAEGMSGSPVYITGADGVRRLIGAIAYGEGDEKNVIGGITPIEQMLASVAGNRALSREPRVAPVVSRPVRIARTDAEATAIRRREPGARIMHPLQRWVASGLDSRLMPVVRRLLGSTAQVQASGATPARPPVTLEPGASLSAMIATGDVVLGGIGTVTYVDGDLVLGWGHPLFGAGATRMLMGDGWITTVVSAPIKSASYKLGQPGTVQGMISGDRTDGISGHIGPVTAVEQVVTARDTRRGTSTTLTTRLAPQAELLPALADLAPTQALYRVRDGLMSGTLTMTVRIKAPGLGSFSYRNTYAGAGDVVGLAYGRVGSFVSTLVGNPLRELMPTQITVDQTLDPEVRAGGVMSARIVPARVRPGQRAALVLTMRYWRGGVHRLRLPFRVPADATPGPVAFRVVPNDRNGFEAAIMDLSGPALGQSAPLPAMVAPRAAEEPRGVGTPVERIRRTLRRSADDRHDAVRLLAPGEEDTGPSVGLQVPTDGVVVAGGRAVARATVLPRRRR